MKKICDIINKIYGILMFSSFFGGFLPLIPFIIAIIIGGSTGEAISIFLYNQYYPWVIALASIAIIVGLIGMYLGKQQALSVKKINADKENNSAN